MRILLLSLVALSVVAPRAAVAQKLSDLSTVIQQQPEQQILRRFAPRDDSLTARYQSGAAKGKAHRWTYILAGTAVGVGVAAISLATDSNKDEMVDALVGPPTIATGALLGAGIGWLVYHIRHGHDGDEPR